MVNAAAISTTALNVAAISFCLNDKFIVYYSVFNGLRSLFLLLTTKWRANNIHIYQQNRAPIY